jgi:hypothetical protein
MCPFTGVEKIVSSKNEKNVAFYWEGLCFQKVVSPGEKIIAVNTLGRVSSAAKKMWVFFQ